MTEPTLNATARADLADQARVDICQLLDLQLSPLGMRAIDALSPLLSDVVVDVGCGAGQSVLQLAERVGLNGRVIGVDIARLSLDLARRRALIGFPQVSFLEADAQSLNLPDQSADGIFSRFGVMAFIDPLAAFSNFHRILKPSGKLAFVCWRALQDNELDLLPLRTAGLEAMADPTPFSFADAGFLRATLQAAGFNDVVVQAGDEQVSSGNLEAMTTVLLRVGPLGRILRENPHLRADAEPQLRAALVSHEKNGTVALRAATWIVTARPGAQMSVWVESSHERLKMHPRFRCYRTPTGGQAGLIRSSAGAGREHLHEAATPASDVAASSIAWRSTTAATADRMGSHSASR